jgi:hypothetical protein
VAGLCGRRERNSGVRKGGYSISARGNSGLALHAAIGSMSVVSAGGRPWVCRRARGAAIGPALAIRDPAPRPTFRRRTAGRPSPSSGPAAGSRTATEPDHQRAPPGTTGRGLDHEAPWQPYTRSRLQGWFHRRKFGPWQTEERSRLLEHVALAVQPSLLAIRSSKSP